jgi:hypothetical protein
MELEDKIVLTGGNMNKLVLSNNTVYKDINPATNNIHKLLGYVRSKGIDWVPESYGIINDKHALSFLPGNVIHDNPDWIWNKSILIQSAQKLRQWHDATIGFQPLDSNWLLSNDEEQEVICHNDFAPYNWVFNKENELIGLIDFDTCNPGSRLWDIAYTAYRIVPLMPFDDINIYSEISPFNIGKMKERLSKFLEIYAGNDKDHFYSINTVINKVQKRLIKIATWSENEGHKNNNQELIGHAKMYRLHCEWLRTKFI